jgi:TRAP-type C4-dicarboxylate transport system permease small subunit
VQHFLKRVVIYLGTLTVALVTVFGFVLVVETWAQITPALGISVALPYAAIPVSFLLMTLYGIVHVIRDINGFPPLAWDKKE